MAVVGGTLQSLVKATPKRYGQTNLQFFHSLIRPPGMGTGLQPYCTTTEINNQTKQELIWWRTFLRSGNGRQVRGRHAATIIPTWGDGSGTGTGGTIQIPKMSLRMWKGTWDPFVFHFTSNWKELTTLLETILIIVREAPHMLTEATIFYFTDNSVTYWIASPGASAILRLHKS